MSQPSIFITGATGFIGSQVLSQTLKAGYHVRLSVRREPQIATLKSLFSEYAAKLDFVIIPDLAKPGAFGHALNGIEYVFHVASPMPGTGDNFKTDYYTPAVQGTITLLDAAKNVETIKRVVIVASIVDFVELGTFIDGKWHAKGKLAHLFRTRSIATT
jgi:nucleoside-diphosphate-sugar epimerase